MRFQTRNRNVPANSAPAPTPLACGSQAPRLRGAIFLLFPDATLDGGQSAVTTEVLTRLPSVRFGGQLYLTVCGLSAKAELRRLLGIGADHGTLSETWD